MVKPKKGKGPEYTYKIRRGAPFSQEDAPTIAGALMELIKANGGGLTAQQVLEAAESPTSVLHRYFDWDDVSAARKYRLNQARQIIRAVQYEVTTGTITINTGAFVRVYNTDQLPGVAPGPAYVPLPTAVAHVDFNEQILSRALQELRSFEARYRTIALSVSEFRPIFEAIGVMEGLVQARQKPKDG